MSVTIQLRRGTAAQWASSNRVLAAGEVGVETDTHRAKVGDGTSAWNSLPYLDDPSHDGTSYAPILSSLSAGIVSTSADGALTVGKHNEVDATSGARAMTLANATAAGQVVSFEKSDNSTNAVTLTLNLRGTSSSTLTLSLYREAIVLVSKSDGSWYPFADHKTLSSLDGRYVAISSRTSTKTSNYTAALGQLVPCDTSGGSFTVTLPAASGGKGRIVVKLVTAGNPLNLALTGSDHFNTTSGSTSGTLTLTNQAVTVESDGTSIWTVVSDDIPKSALDGIYQSIVKMTGVAATDTAAIQAAIDAGGRILIAGGSSTWTVNQLLIKSNAHLDLGGCTLQLANSANTDLVTVPNFGTLTGTASTGGECLWSIRNGNLDGNCTNQAGGVNYAFRVYGYSYGIDRVIFLNGGVYSEWAGSASSSLTGGHMEASWTNFKIIEHPTVGLDWNGPHDSTFSTGVIASSRTNFAVGTIGLVTRGGSGGEAFTNVHVWNKHEVAARFEHSALLTACYFEGASLSQLVARAPIRGTVRLLNANNRADISLQIGEAGTAVSNCDLRVRLDSGTNASSVPISFVNSGGGNRISGTWVKGSVTALYGTAPTINDDVDMLCTDAPASSVRTRFGAPVVREYTSTTSNVAVPSGVLGAFVTLIAPGNSGGSGRRGASGSVCGGGGGGGSPALIYDAFVPASALGSTYTVTIPAAPSGGAAVTTNDTNGNAGSGGGTTSFVSGTFRLQVAGGGGGGGGTTSGGSSGSGITPGGGGGTGAAGSNGGGATTGTPLISGGGSGGGGGGISATPTAFNGGNYGANFALNLSAAGGGVVDTTAPTAAALQAGGIPTSGGGGGAASITAAGQAGADGVGYGAPGGGGGASLNGFNSGRGGNGGPGYARVTFVYP